MKISGDSDGLAEEICVILNLQKRLKENQKHFISNILRYGILILDDFDEIGGS